MSGAHFQLPRIAPDFAVMSRDALENYAAQVDYALRNLQGEVECGVLQLMAFFNALAAAHPDFAKLTSTEALFLSALKPHPQSKEVIHQSVYADQIDGPEPKIVDVYICKLRQKIKPLGLRIDTLWGRGYNFPDHATFWAMIQAWGTNAALPNLVSAPIVPVKTREINSTAFAKIRKLRMDGVGPTAIARDLGLSVSQADYCLGVLKAEGHHFPPLSSWARRHD